MITPITAKDYTDKNRCNHLCYLCNRCRRHNALEVLVSREQMPYTKRTHALNYYLAQKNGRC